MSAVNTTAAVMSNSRSVNCVPPTTRLYGSDTTSPGATSQGRVPLGTCGTVTVRLRAADCPGTNCAPGPNHSGSTSTLCSQRITATLTSGTETFGPSTHTGDSTAPNSSGSSSVSSWFKRASVS